MANNPETKGALIVAVEDEAVLILHALFGDDGQLLEMGETFSIEREQYGPGKTSSNAGHVYVDDILDITCGAAKSYLQQNKRIDAIAVSTFGQVEAQTGRIRHASGFDAQEEIATFDFPNVIKARIPELKGSFVSVYNDATASAYGEYLSGAGRGHEGAFAAIHLGRGMNAGFIVEGKPWSGVVHPELAHFFPRIPDNDRAYYDLTHSDPRPKCAIHRNCLLGLVSERAVLARMEAGMPENEIIDIYGYYAAQLCVTITLMAAPARIALGGSLFRRGRLPKDATMQSVRHHFTSLIKDYPIYPQTTRSGGFIVDTLLEDKAATVALMHVSRQKLLSWA